MAIPKYDEIMLPLLKIEGSGEKAVLVGFDVNDPSTRKKALKLRNNEEVQGLFCNF